MLKIREVPPCCFNVLHPCQSTYLDKESLENLRDCKLGKGSQNKWKSMVFYQKKNYDPPLPPSWFGLSKKFYFKILIGFFVHPSIAIWWMRKSHKNVAKLIKWKPIHFLNRFSIHTSQCFDSLSISNSFCLSKIMCVFSNSSNANKMQLKMFKNWSRSKEFDWYYKPVFFIS